MQRCLATNYDHGGENREIEAGREGGKNNKIAGLIWFVWDTPVLLPLIYNQIYVIKAQFIHNTTRCQFMILIWCLLFVSAYVDDVYN